MVERQLRGRGIGDERVLRAMSTVPRERFVPEAERPFAYEDAALAIGAGQTISQPYMVARICAELALRGDERVLDVGTGSGYQAAVLAELAAEVHTIERIPELAETARATLAAWTTRLRREAGEGFPEKVTAFREGMAVHGRYQLPCPECGAPVQRIRYADNETNYCARCQTGGRLLADRALSRLLKQDWPRSIDEVE